MKQFILNHLPAINKNMIKMLLVYLLSISFNYAHAQLSVKQVAKECKGHMKPFFYDGSVISDIIITDQAQLVEVEFTGLSETQYKLVICTSGFEEKFSINIYDRNQYAYNRTKIEGLTQSEDKKVWIFEPPKPGLYYINYSIGASVNGKEKEAFIIMLIGFKE
jgi:hypothetical protein